MAAIQTTSAISRQVPVIFMLSDQTNKNHGPWLIIAAAFLWGTTGTAQAFAPSGFDPKVIGALRLLIGGLALLILVIRRKELGKFKDWPLLAVIVGSAFTAAYQICFFSAVARTGVAVGTIVGIGSAPIAGGLFGWIGLRERPGRRWFFATLLAIAGCAFLSLGGADIDVDLIGILLAIAAGASYALYTLMIKKILRVQPPNAVIAIMTCGGAIFLLPALIHLDTAWLFQPRSLMVVLHLGLATMALSYWFFARGLQTVQVSTATTLSLAEPMTAATLGVLVLGEKLNSSAACGILLIFLGLVILILRRRS